MGKDNRPWRKLVKKLRRKRIRQAVAQERDAKEISDLLTQADFKEQLRQQEMQKLRDEEECIQHELEEQKWIENELQDQLKYRMEKAKQDKLDAIKAAEEKKIREEWNERVEKEKKMQEEKERVEKELKEKQEEEFDTFLSFLCGDIETPPLPYVMPEAIDNGKETCSFFQKTGVCLFGDQCSRNHLRPTLSSVILIPNFFSNFSLEQSQRDEYDTDLFLECDDSDLHKEFLEFYDDIMPEFRKFGKIIQFKVCRNFGAHLRGNVYIQYENMRQSVDAYRGFNGRFYNGKQLSLQFSKIDSWKSAICGLFLRKRCLKGKACNFLHVFRNPTTEFVSADQDWKKPDPVHQKSVGNDSKSPREMGNSKTDSSRHSKSSFFSESSNKNYRRSRSKSPKHTSVSNSYRNREHNFRNRDKHRSTDKHRHRHSRRSSSKSRSPKPKQTKKVHSPDKTKDYTKESPTCIDDKGQKISSKASENTSTDERKSKLRKKSKKKKEKKEKKEKKHRKHKKESKLSKEIEKE